MIARRSCGAHVRNATRRRRITAASCKRATMSTDTNTSNQQASCAPFNSAARKSAEQTRCTVYRAAPHNIEAEQALLGAILVNNEALLSRLAIFSSRCISSSPPSADLRDRRAAHPRRQGRHAGHAQDLPARRRRHRRADLSQYLARLAAEATTVINAEDYGRTIYDLSIRRDADHDRRGHGQRRLRGAGRFRAARADRGCRAAALRARGNRPVRGRLPAIRGSADDRGRHGGERLSARRQTVGPRDRPGRPRPHDGRPAEIRPDHPRRPPRHGQDRACDQHRLQRRQGLARRGARRRPYQDGQRRHRRLLLARNVGGAARHPYPRRADGNPLVHIRRGAINEPISNASWRPRRRCSASRSISTRPAAFRSRSSPRAPAG